MSGLDQIKYNEYTKDLIVNDDDYLSYAKKYMKIGEKMDEYYQEYIKVMKKCAGDNKGTFAQSLRDFIDTANLLYGECVKGLTTSLNSVMKDYIASIDDADGSWN